VLIFSRPDAPYRCFALAMGRLEQAGHHDHGFVAEPPSKLR
jgi:hypothetical protein